MNRVVSAQGAPAAIGPYSQAIEAGGFIFVSGQLPLDPVAGRIVDDDVGRQTRRSIENLAAILEAAGSSLDDVVKASVFLRNMDDFAAMNEVYAEFFSKSPPARAAVQVARLPLDARVEIEAVAVCERVLGGRR